LIADYLVALWIAGGVLLIVGIVLLAVARAADRKNYIIQKATPMPLSLVNERDDVWLRGHALCDAPLRAPHFGHECIAFHYKLEERVRRTRRTKKGTTTYYTWETREKYSEAAEFTLHDGEQSIVVDGPKAEFKDMLSSSERVGSWRHSLSYIPDDATLSAVGSVGEKRALLEPYMSIPLIVTPRSRKEYIRAAEAAEKWMRFFGFLCIWLGAGAAGYGLLDHTGWPEPTFGVFNVTVLLTGLGVATVVYLPVWTMYIYNTLVTYRVRADNAWRQIDVDVKMRYDLIPQLVAAAKGSMEHERDLLERLAALRAKATGGGRKTLVSAEEQTVAAIRQFQVAVENYPDVKNSQVVSKLMRELTAIEEKIAHGRAVYNEAVEEYNTNVMAFPRALLARLLGFGARNYFGAASAERAPIRVST
jgi:LemA protein